jgi:hypothetical protein
MKIQLLSLLRKLLIGCRQPWATVLRSFSRLIERLLSNPHIADLWRFIFLGTLVETGRVVGQKMVDAVSSCTSITVVIGVILNFRVSSLRGTLPHTV